MDPEAVNRAFDAVLLTDPFVTVPGVHVGRFASS